MSEEKVVISDAELFDDEELDEIYNEVNSSDFQTTAEFLHKNQHEFYGKMTPEGYPSYSPKYEALIKIGNVQKGFYVHYSIPKDHNKKTAVASVWSVIESDGKQRFVINHYDFSKIMEPILTYLIERGHTPPPPRVVLKK